jgi:hypothetical protein
MEHLLGEVAQAHQAFLSLDHASAAPLCVLVGTLKTGTGFWCLPLAAGGNIRSYFGLSA